MTDFTTEPTVPLIGMFGRRIYLPSASFARPNNTTAYAAGNLVANSTTAGSVAPMQFNVSGLNGATGAIRRCTISKTSAGLTNAQFRLHLYTTSPAPPVGGDGAAWSTALSGYIGSLSMAGAMPYAFANPAAAWGAAVPDTGSEINFVIPSAQAVLYGLLAAVGAYTPVAQEVFTVSLEVQGN